MALHPAETLSGAAAEAMEDARAFFLHGLMPTRGLDALDLLIRRKLELIEGRATPPPRVKRGKLFPLCVLVCVRRTTHIWGENSRVCLCGARATGSA